MNPPCKSGKALRGFTVITGSRHEKSTRVTGRSPADAGLETGDEVVCRRRTNSGSRVGLAASDEHNPDQAKGASSHQVISESLTGS